MPGRLPVGVVERREKMIQTYILVFGLLLAYDRDAELQARLMNMFVYFLLFALLYFVYLTRFFNRKFLIVVNLAALTSAFIFCYSFVFCSGNFSDFYVMSFVLFLWMFCIVFLSLVV